MTSYCLYRMLERRFDGEIPDHLRRAALAGGERAAIAAWTASRACDRMALAAQRRADGAALRAWRSQGLAWFFACRSAGPG
ncbi:MAG TPA: hypothetical protein VFA23_09250 [Dongiaceae bacterium]|nr:hypothetical protein [Dongiaceae bacterium]